MDIFPALLSVFFFRQAINLRIGSLSVDLFQKRDAPTTARAGAAALRKLTRHPRLMNAREVDELSPRDVEAKANRIVEFHDGKPETNSIVWSILFDQRIVSSP